MDKCPTLYTPDSQYNCVCPSGSSNEGVVDIYVYQIIYNLFSALLSTVYHCGLGYAYELESAVFGSGSGYQSTTGNDGHSIIHTD